MIVVAPRLPALFGPFSCLLVWGFHILTSSTPTYIEMILIGTSTIYQFIVRADWFMRIGLFLYYSIILRRSLRAYSPDMCSMSPLSSVVDSTDEDMSDSAIAVWSLFASSSRVEASICLGQKHCGSRAFFQPFRKICRKFQLLRFSHTQTTAPHR
ncbi:hypothetical protein BT96DRAFT_178541 [Gymnopus androsaceus JB14]|uniref:Uncharacterized protein n=1 Tax=Gymnopus androsaceus JB14 TaxID=1447944 RepID=A0A6A4GBD2_9AGAR|nr:hypothetical protein BT96DRAFT_178541 [Gymnopus androsaceus JB14]